VAAPLREAERVAWSLSPFTNVYAVGRLSDQLADLNWRPRFGAAVLGGFAIIVFVLAALGLYAVIAYTVAQRRREIGVRMALGGTPGVIVRNVVGSALGLAAVGIAAGNMLAVAFARSLRGLLFGVARSGLRGSDREPKTRKVGTRFVPGPGEVYKRTLNGCRICDVWVEKAARRLA
jgi:ABC-type antimicrobial peptide transport system permease subunit